MTKKETLLDLRNRFLSSVWKTYPCLSQKELKPRDWVGRWLENEIHILTPSTQENSTFAPLYLDGFVMLEDSSLDATEILRAGDIIRVLVDVKKVQLLTPCLLPSPTQKQNWIPNYRQRFNEGVLWLQFQQKIREFWLKSDFLEVPTPKLVLCPGTEPTLELFSTILKLGSKTEKLFLPTSPELHLKKALTFGLPRIFEMASCFRNGESTNHHRPEFIMLEWYRLISNLEEIQNDVLNLICFLAKTFSLAAPRSVQVRTVAELFQEHCHFTLTTTTSIEELRELAQRWKIDVASATNIDDFFFLIFNEKIESQFNPEDLVFVCKYPPYQAALSRLDEEGWGQRFEVYWRGLELGNAFHELNDPILQRHRFGEDLSKKALQGKEVPPLDSEFLESLDFGMAPAAGIAMGVERLYMALFNKKNIKSARLFV